MEQNDIINGIRKITKFVYKNEGYYKNVETIRLIIPTLNSCLAIHVPRRNGV